MGSGVTLSGSHPGRLSGCLGVLLLAVSGGAVAGVGWDTYGTVRTPDGRVKVTVPLYRLLNEAGFQTHFDRLPGTPGGAATVPSLRVTAPANVPVGPGGVAAMTAERSISARGIAAAMTRAALGPAGVAMSIAAGAAWCKYTTGSLLCDERQDQVADNVWRYGRSLTPSSLMTFVTPESVVQNGKGTLIGLSCTGGPLGTAMWEGSVVPARVYSCSYRTPAFNPADPPAGPYFESVQAAQIPGVPTCPAAPDFGDPRYSVPGGPPDADGKCPTGRYVGFPESVTVDRVVPHIDGTNAPDIVREVGERNPGAVDDLSNTPGSVTGPSSVPGPERTVTTTPPGGGSPTSATYYTTYNITYAGDTFNVTSTETTIKPDGTTETETKPVEFKTCGLPGTPACKMDETGTATDTVSAAAVAAAQAAIDAQTGLINAPPVASLPSVWSFALPTGACSVLTYTGRIGSFSVDLCSNPYVLAFRSLLAWLFVSIAGLYCWRTLSETTGGR